MEQAKALSPTQRDAAYFSPRFDVFRVEWERAAWTHAGRPAGEDAAKRALLRWRLHSLLATWTGGLEHYRQAQQARPDLWLTLAALGCALGQSGQTARAIEYLRAAVAANPLDAAAARALYHALGQASDHAAQQELRQDRRRLATAFPQLAPEPWLQGALQFAPVAAADTNADWLEILTPEVFVARFGSEDIRRALCGYTKSPGHAGRSDTAGSRSATTPTGGRHRLGPHDRQLHRVESRRGADFLAWHHGRVARRHRHAPALLTDHYTHAEPGAAFYPTGPDECWNISVFLLPVEEDVSLVCCYSLGGLTDWLDYDEAKPWKAKAAVV